MARSKFGAVVEITGLDTSEAMLKAIGDRAFDTYLLMEELTEDLEIAARARNQGSPWAPLTEGTVARKASQGEDTGIFRDEWRPIKGTPTRKGDALWTALSGGAGSYRASTRASATFGIRNTGDLFYARMVQNTKGTKRKLLAIPAEYAVAMTEHVVRYILDIPWGK